jgi:hypothetical protein
VPCVQGYSYTTGIAGIKYVMGRNQKYEKLFKTIINNGDKTDLTRADFLLDRKFRDVLGQINWTRSSHSGGFEEFCLVVYVYNSV